MNDTRAQRSWVYGGASMFSENQKGERSLPKPSTVPTSLDTRSGSGGVRDPNADNKRASTTVTQAKSTGISKRGSGIWMD